MQLKLISKQSLYILIVTLLIAFLTVITVHGISETVSNASNYPIVKTTENPDSIDGFRENVPVKNESVKIQDSRPTIPDPGDSVTKADTSCKVAGCNHELCISADDNSTVSSCNNQEVNKCYQNATCALQAGGKCGWSVNATLTRCINDSNFATQTMRVIQIKLISNPSDIPYDPDTLSTELRNYIQTASAFHKYKDSLAKSAVNVQLVENITVNHPLENIENYWYGGYYKLIQELGLCQKIADEKIDQIWMWVDPRDSSGGPGLEYVMSGKWFIKNNPDQAGVARPPFCQGANSFVMMGFDYTRTSDLALHSFGHYMESMIATAQSGILFGKFTGNYNSSIQGRYQCGNVHFPPNGTVDYDYANVTAKPTYCENWDPNLDQNSAVLQSYNCTRWGCSDQGYFTWWLQNMPGPNSPLNYQGKTLPSWWDFTVDFDTKIQKYYSNTNYYVDRTTYDTNNVDLNNNCSCDGVDEDGNGINTTQCWSSRTLYGGGCFTCTKDTFYQVPALFCD